MTALRIEQELAGLLAKIEPKARRTLAQEIAKTLRTSQQKRIAAQLNPDGTAFEPRKPQIRGQKGKIRRQMFAKLRTSRYLRMESTSEAAVIAFASQVQRIAQVHQYGLRDRVQSGGPEVPYAERRLLGFTDQDISVIAKQVIERFVE